MRNYLILFMLAAVSVVSYGQELKTPGDSLSYCYGFLSTRGLMAGENDLMRTPEDLKEYIAGLEESEFKPSLSQELLVGKDNPSYGVGAMQAIFFLNSLEHSDSVSVSIEDMVAGLNDGAGENFARMDTARCSRFLKENPIKKLILPNDSVAFRTASYALGMLASYPRDLDKYLADMGLEGKPDRVMYAKGYAAGLSKMKVPTSSREMGRRLGDSVNQGMDMIGVEIDKKLYIEGAKAGVWLAEPLIPFDDADQYVNDFFEKSIVVTQKEE